jgi:hypothetical protein
MCLIVNGWIARSVFGSLRPTRCCLPVESKPRFGYNARPVYLATAEYTGIHTLVHVGVSLETHGGSGWRVEDLTLNDWRITWQ